MHRPDYHVTPDKEGSGMIAGCCFALFIMIYIGVVTWDVISRLLSK